MQLKKKKSFNIVGYGCMTCIGNSGPLPESVVEAIEKVLTILKRAKLIRKRNINNLVFLKKE
jgi:aconitase A